MVKEGLLGDAICKETRREKGGVLWRYLEQEASGQMQESMNRVCTASVGLCLQCKRPMFNPWVRKIPWKREWLSTPVFLSGEFHRQMSLAGYSPWGHKGLDTTKQLTLSLFTEFIQVLILEHMFPEGKLGDNITNSIPAVNSIVKNKDSGVRLSISYVFWI